MMINKPIEIDLQEFFKTGCFDYLKLGQDKSWILNNFPSPDSRWDKDMQRKGFDIWNYGNIELHFENDKLFLIYADDLEGLHGGKHINLERWIFEDSEDLNLGNVLKILNESSIDYKKQSDALGVLLRLGCGIELTFENIEDEKDLSPHHFLLTSFGLVEENARRWRI